MAGVKIVDLPALGRDLINTDLLEVSLNGGGSRKITGQEIMNASKLAIGSTPIVSGTVGRLLFQGAGNVLSQPSSLFYDAVNNRLGIGTTTPGASLDVVYESTFQSRIDMYGTLYMYNNITSLSGNIWLNDGYAIGDWGTGNNRIEFYSNRLSFFGNGNEALRIVGSTQNVLIGTTTDAGFKFNVNGTARIQNVLTIQNLTADLYVRTTAWSGQSRIWFGDDSSDTIGGINYEHQFDRMNLRTNAGTRMTLFSTGNVGINTTTDDGFRLDVNGTARVTMGASAEFRLGTSSALPAMLYATGSTSYLMRWKNDGSEVYLQGGTFAVLRNTTQEFVLQSNFTYLSAGNLAIGTATNAGYKLDVNGTARVQGNTTVTGSISLGTNQSIGDGNFSVNVNRLESYNAYRIRTLADNRYVYLSPGNTDILYANYWAGGNFAGVVVQDVAGTTQSTSAVLQANSTTRGFLPPRMTNAQRAAIASPAVGLIVYCTDATEGLYVYKSTGWTFMV